MERLYIDSTDRIEPYENHLVRVVRADGQVLEALEPRRLFPVNMPDEYVTFLDAEGTEICLLRDMSTLDPASRRTVRASLDDYYLVPRIHRIISFSDKYGTVHWTVDTDRGVKSFDIRNRNHDIRVSKNGYVRIRDADDNRYVIEDYHDLDRHSRAALIADL